MNQIDRRKLKREAREAMGLTSPRFWVVALVFILLTTGVSLLLDTLSTLINPAAETFSFFGFFVSILFLLYSIIINFGYNLWSLWTYRKLNPGLGSLLQGFSVSGRVILMEIIITLWVAIWVFVLATIITIVIVLIPSVPVIVLSILALYAAIFVIQLRYSMAPYLLADRPDDGAGAAVRRSVEMMRGRKWQLFKLQFSFIGWYLIEFLLAGAVIVFFILKSGVLNTPVTADSVLVYQSVIFGLAPSILSSLITLPLSLWLIPYVSVTQAGFYDTLCRQGYTSEYDQMPPL